MEGGQSMKRKRETQFSTSEVHEKEEENDGINSWIGGEIIMGACDLILGIEQELVQDLSSLNFGLPVAYVYNPLVYAWEMHEQYVRKYGGRRVEVLLVGMNPGPFGMAQTGVPFGDNIIVRDFLKISGKVDSPSATHPKRQIYGLDCPRREVSGQRLWGWAEKQFHCAEKFLNRFWIHNYCPLLFMEASGKNRTPDKLPANERELLETCCNKALIATINLIQPRLVVGV
ncbi:hypothetical protein KI387_020740, partial [Taxus chinensis]